MTSFFLKNTSMLWTAGNKRCLRVGELAEWQENDRQCKAAPKVKKKKNPFQQRV